MGRCVEAKKTCLLILAVGLILLVEFTKLFLNPGSGLLTNTASNSTTEALGKGGALERRALEIVRLWEEARNYTHAPWH